MGTEEYNGIQKAAILLIALGPEKSASIFKHLKEDEIEELMQENRQFSDVIVQFDFNPTSGF